MQIWLQANLDAHAFIPVSFWTGHFEMVRDMLPQAELYVHENEAPRQIDGFIGLTENHIEGIFVAKAARSKGIGKALLEYTKSRKPCLTLSVYQKNQRALAFYRREQFVVQSEGIDENIAKYGTKDNLVHRMGSSCSSLGGAFRKCIF